MACCMRSSCGSGMFWWVAVCAVVAGSVGMMRQESSPKGTPAQPAPGVQPGTPAPKPADPPKGEEGSKTPDASKAVSPYVLGYTMKTIDGADKNLADYKGSVVVMVNTASKCGFTPQYKSLEALYKSKKDSGLVILGFPCNDFGGQEPGTEKEIKQFCESKYSVSFPMFAKIKVKGDDAHPLYKQLRDQPAPIGGEPKWNFTKFVVDRSGNVVARFDSRVKPDDQEFTRVVNDLLSKKD